MLFSREKVNNSNKRGQRRQAVVLICSPLQTCLRHSQPFDDPRPEWRGLHEVEESIPSPRIPLTDFAKNGTITCHYLLGELMRNIYLLKDLSRRSGYSTHTLKYYLRLGLFAEIGRSPETNFRYFDDSTLKRLEKIKELRAKNFSLKKILEQLSS